jgi:hypothetical protein
MSSLLLKKLTGYCTSKEYTDEGGRGVAREYYDSLLYDGHVASCYTFSMN